MQAGGFNDFQLCAVLSNGSVLIMERIRILTMNECQGLANGRSQVLFYMVPPIGGLLCFRGWRRFW